MQERKIIIKAKRCRKIQEEVKWKDTESKKENQFKKNYIK